MEIKFETQSIIGLPNYTRKRGLANTYRYWRGVWIITTDIKAMDMNADFHSIHFAHSLFYEILKLNKMYQGLHLIRKYTIK